MSSFEPKTILDFELLASPNANTAIAVDHTYANGSVVTLHIQMKQILAGLPGPYADDSAAAAANVAVGYGYYTSAGAVKIRVA